MAEGFGYEGAWPLSALSTGGAHAQASCADRAWTVVSASEWRVAKVRICMRPARSRVGRIHQRAAGRGARMAPDEAFAELGFFSVLSKRGLFG